MEQPITKLELWSAVKRLIDGLDHANSFFDPDVSRGAPTLVEINNLKTQLKDVMTRIPNVLNLLERYLTSFSAKK